MKSEYFFILLHQYKICLSVLRKWIRINLSLIVIIALSLFFKNWINQEINNSGSRLRSARSTCIVAAILTVQQFLSPQKISLEKRAAEHNNRNSSEKWFKYMVTALLNYERYRTIKPEKNVANKNCSSNAFD